MDRSASKTMLRMIYKKKNIIKKPDNDFVSTHFEQHKRLIWMTVMVTSMIPAIATSAMSVTTNGAPHTSSVNNMGKPMPKKMLNTLLPTAFATAISPSPLFATMTELRVSGMDVPAAKTTKPMMYELMLNRQPMWYANSTMPQLTIQIHLSGNAATKHG